MKTARQCFVLEQVDLYQNYFSFGNPIFGIRCKTARQGVGWEFAITMWIKLLIKILLHINFDCKAFPKLAFELLDTRLGSNIDCKMRSNNPTSGLYILKG